MWGFIEGITNDLLWYLSALCSFACQPPGAKACGAQSLPANIESVAESWDPRNLESESDLELVEMPATRCTPTWPTSSEGVHRGKTLSSCRSLFGHCNWSYPHTTRIHMLLHPFSTVSGKRSCIDAMVEVLLCEPYGWAKHLSTKSRFFFCTARVRHTNKFCQVDTYRNEKPSDKMIDFYMQHK